MPKNPFAQPSQEYPMEYSEVVIRTYAESRVGTCSERGNSRSGFSRASHSSRDVFTGKGFPSDVRCQDGLKADWAPQQVVISGREVKPTDHDERRGSKDSGPGSN